MSDINFLIVEDSPTMRQLITFALKRIQKAKVVEATDGVDALKKMVGQNFDMLFVDINMPVMDGLKFVSLVRADPTKKDVPIIMITTEGAEEDRKRALSLGASAYLTKPILIQELLQIVSQHLKQ